MVSYDQDGTDDSVSTVLLLCKLYPKLTLKEAFEKLDDVEFLEKTLKILDKEASKV